MIRYLMLITIIIFLVGLMYCNAFVYQTVAEKLGLLIAIGIGIGSAYLIGQWKRIY